MPYRFKIDEPVEKGFRRIASEQLDVVLSELAAPDLQPKGVHEIRKALKRLRALVRLAAPSLGQKEGKRRAKSLGEIGRMLSGRRDEAVLRETIEKLSGESGSDAAIVLTPWRAHFSTDEATLARIDHQIVAQMRTLLLSESKHFAHARLRHRGFAALKGGLENSYRRARKALKDAYREPSDESFHSLRKTVQWHWRQMSLLARAWPDEYAVRVAAARELSQVLGDDHDLAMLIAATIKAGDFSAEEKEAIVDLCIARQRKIRASVEPRARRLFAENSNAFIARMSEYWKCGRVAPFPDIVPIVRSGTKDHVVADGSAIATVTTLEGATTSKSRTGGTSSPAAAPSQRRA